MAPLPEHTQSTGLETGLRHLRQAQSGLTWVPESAPSVAGWHGEKIISGGAVTVMSPPPEGVPLHLLRRLKNVFDPHRGLACPGWLDAKEAGGE